MGGLFSSKSKTTSTSTTDTGASKFQQPYLTSAFDAAQSNYNAAKDTPFYTGELYAGMSDSAKSSLDAMKNYATGTGLTNAGTLSSLGTSLSGNFDKASSALDQFSALAGQDATQSNIDAASKYASNPYLDGQIDAVNRDVSRTLAEQTLPTIDRTASGTGNINSSRAGVASGIAQRGAEDRMADNAATLRGNAYSQGLALASADRGQNLNALSTAANGYANLGASGISAINAGTQAGYGAYDQINQANAAEQADRQGQDDADYAAWQGQDSRASDLLNRYYQIIGANQWGSTGTSTGSSTSKSSPGLGSLALGGLSLAGGLGWSPFGK